MARYRANRDPRETEPERGRRIAEESRAERARRVAHYKALAEQAERLRIIREQRKT